MEQGCHKVKFATEKDALFYINKLKQTSKREKIPTRAYLCGYCRTWHLTSKVDFNKEVEILNDKISLLEKENLALKQENLTLKSVDNKQANHEAKVDVRVQNYKRRLNAKEKELNLLRKTNGELINKMLQLEKVKQK